MNSFVTQWWAPFVGSYFTDIQTLLQHLLNVGIGKSKWCVEWILQPQTQCCKSVATGYYGSGAEGNSEKMLLFPFSGLRHHFFDLWQHFFGVADVHLWCSVHIYCRDYIFEWKGRACTKAHFHSLEVGKPVESTVIDSWTYMLNENEILRAESSPLRIFLTSETIVRLHDLFHMISFKIVVSVIV